MKISVQLEADSAEEFRSLVTSFFIPTTRDAEAPPPAAVTDIQRSVLDGTFGVKSVEPETVTEPVTVAEQPAEAPVEPKKPRGRPRKEPAAEAPAQVTPRPAAAVDAPAPAAAPAVAQGNGEAASLTRQDLLDVFAEYVQRYGASFGYTDISKLLQTHLGDTVRKASDVPEAALPQAISAIKEALAANPFNRKRDYA